MTLNPQGLAVPTHLVTERFVLRRQRLSDNALDFEAVMDSREALREWSDSEWPEDDFTLEANAEDLQMHIGEHERDEAYGFSILTPDEGRLLGSLYINPVAPFLEHYVADAQERAVLEALDARVEYWLRRGTPASFQEALLRDVLTWLSAEWWFTRVALGSRRGMNAQRAVYGAVGLTEVTRLTSRDGQRRFHFHV